MNMHARWQQSGNTHATLKVYRVEQVDQRMASSEGK